MMSLCDRSELDLAVADNTLDDVTLHPEALAAAGATESRESQRQQRRLAPLPPRRYAAQRHNASSFIRRFFSATRHSRIHILYKIYIAYYICFDRTILTGDIKIARRFDERFIYSMG